MAQADVQMVQAEPIPAAPVRQSVLERKEGKGGSGAIWAIAAVLALAAVGGTAYAMRDRFGDLKSALGLGSSTQTAQTTTTTPTTTSATTNSSNATDALAQAVNSLTQSANTAADNAQQAATDAVTQASDSVTQAAQDATANTDQANAGIAGTSDNTELAADGEESLDPLRRMAATRKAELAGGPREEGVRQVARVDQPERVVDPPVRRGPPKVAVLAFGDPAITGPAKQVLEESLMTQGFLLIDTDVVGGLGGGDLARNLMALHRAGASAVAVVRAEPLGSTQLNYYGQSDTLYSASLTVRTYSVETRSPLSAGIREKVDFTALNAEEKAREALDAGLGRVVGSLAAYKPRGQGG
jgi:serine/threonine-protein kinase